MSREEADDVQRMQSTSGSEVSISYGDDIDISKALGSRTSRRTQDIKLICIDMDGKCTLRLVLAIAVPKSPATLLVVRHSCLHAVCWKWQVTKFIVTVVEGRWYTA